MNQNGMTLYRGLTSGKIGLDVHGGYGETWSRRFDDAKGYAHPPHGYVLEAILRPAAKRLVLVTERDKEGFSEYVPEGIKQLAEIVGDPWIYKSFMVYHGALWDEWKPEWTKAIKKAGHDSIFTNGFDGPEEYVLNPSLLQFVRYYRILARDRVEEYPIEASTLEQLGYVVGLVTAVY
jgi:hypothetical protein